MSLRLLELRARIDTSDVLQNKKRMPVNVPENKAPLTLVLLVRIETNLGFGADIRYSSSKGALCRA